MQIYHTSLQEVSVFIKGKKFYDIWNYLNFLNAPEKHDSSLIGILRGPTYGISDTGVI